MRVGDLLEALLLESANDAAVALAQGVSGSREQFVKDMNARARELGLRGTSYANPIGLDDPANYSTATDLALHSPGGCCATGASPRSSACPAPSWSPAAGRGW